MPIDKEYIRIKSTHQPIEETNGQRHVTVEEGEKFEVIFTRKLFNLLF